MRKVIISKRMVAIILVTVLAGSVLGLAPFAAGVGGGQPVATKINYQGQLRDSGGNPLSGTYDMEFRFWDDPVAGSQVGSTITQNDVVATNGLFSVKLDVDESNFNGQALWLEIRVEGEVLGPRQEIVPAAYALHSLSPPSTAVIYEVPAGEGKYVIDMPSFFIDGFGEILLWHDGALGAFEQGFLFPVVYLQSSTDKSWIGGPHISIAGISFSGGEGINGDSTYTYVFEGGYVGEGHIHVWDDSESEQSPNQWTVGFEPGGGLTQVIFYFCPGARLPSP